MTRVRSDIASKNLTTTVIVQDVFFIELDYLCKSSIVIPRSHPAERPLFIKLVVQAANRIIGNAFSSCNTE